MAQITSPPPLARRRIALYSHDTVGLGHLRRNLAIASALAGGPFPVDVLLITGSRESAAFPVPSGIDTVILPAIAKREGEYGARTLGTSLADVIALRSSIITATLKSFAPDLLIVDKVARGACGELEDALCHLRKEGKARLILGLREILDAPAAAISDWEASRTSEAVAAFYDEVWVYGDPTVFDPVGEYRLPPAVAERVTFTGYLGHGRPRPTYRDEANPDSMPPAPYVLCLVGGGQDGMAVARCFAETPLPPGVGARIVTGPYMDEADRDVLRAHATGRPEMSVTSFAGNCEALVAGARSVVSMGGYNTICEVLAAGKRPLVVPRTHPRAEQLLRAERLEQRGMVDLLHPDHLSPARLEAWLAVDTPPPCGPPVDLDGLFRIPGLVERSLYEHSAAASLTDVAV